MPEQDFKEFVETTIRRHEFLSGTVDLDGKIDQFGEFTITVHGKKETLVYTAEDMEAYYMRELDREAGTEALRAVY